MKAVKKPSKASKALSRTIKNSVGEDSNWSAIKGALRKNGLSKGLHKIKKAVNNGKGSHKVIQMIQKVAKKQLKKKMRKSRKGVSKRKPHKKRVSKRNMLRNLKNKPWMKEIRHINRRRRMRFARKWRLIVGVLRKHKFRLEPSWLKNVKRAVIRRRGIFKAITTAPAPQPKKIQQRARAAVQAVRSSPVVYQRRWYLRTRYFLTYYWSGRWIWTPVYRRYFLWWSWLVWGWRWESTPVWYWSSYNYWSYE